MLAQEENGNIISNIQLWVEVFILSVVNRYQLFPIIGVLRLHTRIQVLQHITMMRQEEEAMLLELSPIRLTCKEATSL